mgnify:CR=1 FL=1
MCIRDSKYVALEARKVTRYDELVQLVEAQTMDPITGIMRGDKSLRLSNVQEITEEQIYLVYKEVQDTLNYWGIDVDTEAGQSILNAFNGKSGGKGGKGKGITCWNCGEKGHIARECPKEASPAALQAFQKGKGKGKGGKGGKGNGKSKGKFGKGWQPWYGKGKGKGQGKQAYNLQSDQGWGDWNDEWYAESSWGVSPLGFLGIGKTKDENPSGEGGAVSYTHLTLPTILLV